MSSVSQAPARKNYHSNVFKQLGLGSDDSEGEEERDITMEGQFSDLNLDEHLGNLDEADLVELLAPSVESAVEWQECGVLHTIGEIEIHETRTFAYDDYILGGKVASMCRLKDFEFLNEQKESIAVRELEFETSGVGFRVWDASVVLMSWLYQHVEVFRDKKVIEIGSGCGLPGMFAMKYASATVLSDKTLALLDNLFTCAVMNRGPDDDIQLFPTKLSIPEASVETTAILNPQVSVSFKDGCKTSVCNIDYDVINETKDFQGLFEFLCGSDLTYSPELGVDVAKSSCALLVSFGEGVIVSPEERVGNIDCLIQFMKLGIILSIEFMQHCRQMTPLKFASAILGRKPRECKRDHLVMHFMKFSPSENALTSSSSCRAPPNT